MRHRIDDSRGMYSLRNPQGRGSDRIEEMLLRSGIRKTRQRMAIAGALFRGGHCHMTAEKVLEAVEAGGHGVSLATVYNCLRQFVKAGLLREVSTGQGRCLFDTNTSDHQHFLDAATGKLIDIPAKGMRVSGIPPVPSGKRVAGIEIIVRLENCAG